MVTTFELAKEFPQIGDVVRVRTRTYLVEGVEPGPTGNLIRLACLDDDAQGQALEIIWELELDREIHNHEEVWKQIGDKGFDSARLFGAYVHRFAGIVSLRPIRTCSRLRFGPVFESILTSLSPCERPFDFHASISSSRMT